MSNYKVEIEFYLVIISLVRHEFYKYENIYWNVNTSYSRLESQVLFTLNISSRSESILN